MFTGIITDIGTIRSIEQSGDTRIEIACTYPLAEVAIGASICCAGACLTVTRKDEATGVFAVDVSAETLSKTTLGAWTVGTKINLERSLRIGDELGGHIVTGHVDGIAEVTDVRAEGDSTRVTLRAPDALAPFIAAKGSVALDGCSLTVNSVEGASFGVNLIPHTKGWTTFSTLAPGSKLNLEIDILARYVARLAEMQRG